MLYSLTPQLSSSIFAARKPVHCPSKLPFILRSSFMAIPSRLGQVYDLTAPATSHSLQSSIASQTSVIKVNNTRPLIEHSSHLFIRISVYNFSAHCSSCFLPWFWSEFRYLRSFFKIWFQPAPHSEFASASQTSTFRDSLTTSWLTAAEPSPY